VTEDTIIVAEELKRRLAWTAGASSTPLGGDDGRDPHRPRLTGRETIMKIFGSYTATTTA